MMNVGIVLPDTGYLEAAREIVHRHGALLIFDEVKTGVTIAAGGATERFGVKPDIIALAKAIGGGRCKVEAAVLSPDKQHLAICSEVRTLLGFRVRHVGLMYSIGELSLVGRLAQGRRAGSGWSEVNG